MARPKVKESRNMTLRIDVNILDRLDKYSRETGQTKTSVFEKAITNFIDDYEKKKKILEAVTSTQYPQQ